MRFLLIPTCDAAPALTAALDRGASLPELAVALERCCKVGELLAVYAVALAESRMISSSPTVAASYTTPSTLKSCTATR